MDLKGLTINIVALMALSSLGSILILRRGSLNKLHKIKPIFVNQELINASLPIIVVYLSNIIIKQADKLFIGAFLSSSEVGIYNIAYRLVWSLQLVLLSLGIFPSIIADLFGRGKIEELKNIYSSLVRWVFIVLFPMFLLLNLFPKELMGIFGAEYIQGWFILSILSLFPLIGGLTAQTSPILRMTGHQKDEAIISAVSIVFNLIIYYVLVQRYGIYGIAAGMVLTITLQECIKIIVIYKKVGFHPYNKKMLYPFLVGLLSLLVVILFRRIAFLGSGWEEHILELLIFLAVNFGLGWLVYPLEDKKLVKTAATRLFQRLVKVK